MPKGTWLGDGERLAKVGIDYLYSYARGPPDDVLMVLRTGEGPDSKSRSIVGMGEYND